MAVVDCLDWGTLKNPDGPCLTMGDRQYTYREVQKLTNRIANGLIAAGYGLGRNGAVLSLNDPIAYCCALGIMRTGMPYVPMNYRNSKEDNCWLLDFDDCEVLFYQSRFHDQIQEIHPKLPKLNLLVCIDKQMGDVPSLMDWINPFPDTAPKLEVPLDATALLQTTAGTTGDPKVVMVPHRAFHETMRELLRFYDPNPVMLVVAPITHAAGGFTYHVLARGGSIVLMEKADPQLVLEAIEKYKITMFYLPPTVIYRILDEPNVRDFDYSSLKYLFYGTAPMSVEKLRVALEVFGPVMATAYGQTECLMVTSMSPEEHLSDGKLASDFRLSACGRPTLFNKIVIKDDMNQPLPSGEVGEICVRSEQLMKGYYKNPYATMRTIVDGWLHTGDVGFQDEEGYIHIVDRKKDMIITGGYNVYPSEVEQVIYSLDAVQDCAVIGVPDADWGEAVRAVVELSPGKTITEAEIMSLCKQRLGSIKAPKRVDFLGSLPRSAAGKVLKRELRDKYWKDHRRKI